MKGFQPLFLGIFGIFAFSWLGMTVVPNLQIGSLDPQMDEEGADVYPAPPSGMALRGAQVYAANGCVYCHTQQVRPDYGGSDLERKWGERRSAPRDYIFEPLVQLGKMRTGPDLANVGHRPALAEQGAATPPSEASPAAPATTAAGNPAAAAAPDVGPAPAAAAASPAAIAGAPAAAPAPAAGASPALAKTTASPAAVAAAPAASPAPAAGASPAPAEAVASPAAVAGASAASPAPVAANSPAAAPVTAAAASPAPGASAPPVTAPGGAVPLPAAGDMPAANVATSAPAMVEDLKALTADGKPLPYTAAWHHRHLYNPRSISEDSNMPAYRFLYEKRRIGGVLSPEAINFAGDPHDQPETGWEILPSYDAKCLVAYLMSRDQSHALIEAKSPVALAPAPGKEAQK